MTLVVAAASPKSIWMLTDRRLTFRAQAPRDDARKMMFLQTVDGTAMLGYAGLGFTGRTEPSDWMARVLRGRNVPLENALDILKQAVITHLRPHVDRLWQDRPGHTIIIPAFLNRKPRIYTIDLITYGKTRKFAYRYTRHITPMQPVISWCYCVGWSGRVDRSAADCRQTSASTTWA